MSKFDSYEEDINSIFSILSSDISRIKSNWPDDKAEEFFGYFTEFNSPYCKKLMSVLKEYTDVESRIKSIENCYYRDFEHAR